MLELTITYDERRQTYSIESAGIGNKSGRASARFFLSQIIRLMEKEPDKKFLNELTYNHPTMKMKKRTFCLFEGRHPLPENEGALCSDFDFAEFSPVKSPLWDEALKEIAEGDPIQIIVTGLTPALTTFLKDVASIDDGALISNSGYLTLLHYNSQTGEYVAQTF